VKTWKSINYSDPNSYGSLTFLIPQRLS